MTKKRDKEISLSEKLSSLIQTKPSTVESDDEDLTTVDKIAPQDNDSDFSADELDVSKFRRLNTALLEEDDQKYSGKGISRNELAGSDESEIEDNSNGESVNSSNEEIGSDEEDEDGSEGEDVDEDDDEEGNSSENEDNEESDSSKKPKSESFNKEIFLKASSDIEKGKAIKNQLHLWDFLLECRMKLQKCLLASNQFPNHNNFNKFKSRDSLFQDSVVQCKKSLKKLLNSLLELQNTLLKSNEEYLSLSNIKTDNEEEIASESEEDEKNNSVFAKKLKKLSDFSKEISNRHSDFQAYRNSVIQKWNDKTRVGYISNKNFSAFEQSTLKQIENILVDKQRLIKRTQTKRLNYHILGEEDEEPPAKKPHEDSFGTLTDTKNKGLNKEIFDDDDFYHQLLSEMVKRKANDVTDPVQLGRQWMQLQKIRSKMKKTVDTKASKGRKCRFVVHPKLVNFMMPINYSNYNEDTKIELFNSLFGKTKK